MIEFFEFMNTCSPLRTITYLLFIIGITFILFNSLVTVIDIIINKDRLEEKIEEDE
jgi:hypothetical protein